MASLIVVLALLLPAAPASAATLPAAETRVGASGPATTVAVGVYECITAGQRPDRGPSQLQIVVGNCVAAKSVPGAADDIAVIGRQWDTAVAKDWPGHEVLDIPKWSPAKNDAWVNGIIERQQRVYIASPKTKANLWDAVNNRTTVFGRELGQLFDAGYMRSGDYLLPPG